VPVRVEDWECGRWTCVDEPVSLKHQQAEVMDKAKL
jgi:hypothetical protein